MFLLVLNTRHSPQPMFLVVTHSTIFFTDQLFGDLKYSGKEGWDNRYSVSIGLLPLGSFVSTERDLQLNGNYFFFNGQLLKIWNN